MFEAVAGKAERDQRVVMRPDRAVVIGHRIVAGLAQRHRADAPAGEEMRSHQIGGDLAGAVLTHHAAEQQLPGVGAADLAGLLGPIEREPIGAELLAPECFLKSFREPYYFSTHLLCQLAITEPQRAT